MSARNEFEALKQGLQGLANQGYITRKDEEPENVVQEEHEEFVPPSDLAFQSMGDTESYNYEQYEMQGEVPNFTSQQQPEMNNYYEEGQAPAIDNEDERLWAGGPLKSEVESWKKQYTDIYLADDIDPSIIFVYRPINRYEYKAIIASMNTDPLMREEMICEQCVLFPYDYSYAMMSNGNAGNVSTLSEQILAMSGFTKSSIPRRL